MKNNIKKIIATVFTMTFIVIAVVTVTSCNKKSNITRTEETTNAPSKENTTEYRTEENTTENKTENNSEVTSTENVTTENNIQETQSTTEENTTQVVTQAPTQKPTQTPTQRPTQQPTTQAPTQAPTQKPTEAPTQAPTQAPTEAPTEAPINVPWYRPYLSNGRPDYRNWRTGEGYDSKEERAKNNKIMTDDFLNNFAPSFNFDSNTYVYNNGVLSIKMFYVYNGLYTSLKDPNIKAMSITIYIAVERKDGTYDKYYTSLKNNYNFIFSTSKITLDEFYLY